ncbi:hypothetical protein EMMF5_005868 [Cystobasidiomycetes sp. EMM_F5]
MSKDDLNNPFADATAHDKPDDDTVTPHASTVQLPYHQQAHSGKAFGTANNYASGSNSHDNDETAKRLEEIRRRELELEQRERSLGQREANIRLHGRNNWPPKPFWPFAPLIYHDIQEEIPAESRSIVLTLYRLWLLNIVTIILNLVACILLLVSGAADGAKDLGGSLVDLLVIPLSFVLWYRPVYNAYMKEQSFYYYLYFIFGGFHVAFSIYSLIGIPSTGSAGIINTIKAFADGSILTGVFCVLATVAWGLESAGTLFMGRFVYRHYKDKGHTFAQAKSELSSHGIRAYFSTKNHV